MLFLYDSDKSLLEASPLFIQQKSPRHDEKWEVAG
jgi:hypothetical protein